MRNHVLVYRSFGLPVEQLSLVSCDLPERQPGCLRVAMSLAPINPSDLIPITGAYAHRIALPGIAGYEGVGTVIGAPPAHAALLGRRVLPLRGPGTWQSYVDCDPALAIPVPDAIPDGLAARAYINPLAAATMLDRWPVRGKRVLLSGAGSACAELLARWAVQHGAAAVTGIYRSAHRARRLRALGVEPVCQDDGQAIEHAARAADIAFDALGGDIGSAVLGAMGDGAVFVGYGLLSGQGIRHSRALRAAYRRFHLRDALAGMTASAWQRGFVDLWPRLPTVDLPPPRIFDLANWRSAILEAAVPGAPKSMLRMR
ncbi:MAG: zinc-dependent alcohol dehydrogenase family protein [Pseudomonadota bacterium]